MLFTVHDEEGVITQSNKVYDPNPDPAIGKKHYREVLAEQGMRHVETMHNAPIMPHHHFIKDGELHDRPHMQIRVSRREIAVGELDGVKFTRVPKGARVTVLTGGHVFIDERVDGDIVEYSAQVPAIYVFRFSRFPFRDCEFSITARG